MLFLVKLEKRIRRGSNDNVFEALNIKTNKKKIMKIISDSSYSQEFLKKLEIEKEVKLKCDYLICYDKIYTFDDIQFIMMDYFDNVNVNIENFLNSGNRFYEEVFFFSFLFFLFSFCDLIFLFIRIFYF
jgi:serine/threonine protein kinase